MIKQIERGLDRNYTYQNLHIILDESDSSKLGSITTQFSQCKKNISCIIYCYENILLSKPINKTRELVELCIKAYNSQKIFIHFPEDHLRKYKSLINLVNLYKQVLPLNYEYVNDADEQYTIRCKPI